MRQCTECARVLEIDSFYFVSRSTGKRRGQCKECMRQRKLLQRSPDWRPACSRCGAALTARAGSGRRLCDGCFAYTYEVADRRGNGAHRVRLRPCSLCGGPKERFQRGKVCGGCRPWLPYASSLRRFGLTPAEYVALLDAQDGVCFICGADPGGQRLRIDHDHELPAGRDSIRGLLCNECNYSRLPRFADDVEMLHRAADYLARPPARAVLQRPPPLGGAGRSPGEGSSRPDSPPVGSAPRRNSRSSTARRGGHSSTESRRQAAGEADT